MNQRFRSSLFAMVLGAGLLAGCRTMETSPKPEAQFHAINPAEQASLRQSGIAIGDQMIAAMKSRNHAEFVANLIPEIIDQVTPEKFNELCDFIAREHGTLKSSEFLAELSRPPWVNMVWKLTYTKEVKDSSEPVTQELLFKVTFGKLDGSYKVLAFVMIP